MAARKRRVGMKATDGGKEIRDKLEKDLSDPDTKDALEKILITGLKLKLETARAKNPYFKRSRRGSDQLSRKYKRAAIRFARVFVKGFFVIQWSGQSLN